MAQTVLVFEIWRLRAFACRVWIVRDGECKIAVGVNRRGDTTTRRRIALVSIVKALTFELDSAVRVMSYNRRADVGPGEDEPTVSNVCIIFDRIRSEDLRPSSPRPSSLRPSWLLVCHSPDPGGPISKTPRWLATLPVVVVVAATLAAPSFTPSTTLFTPSFALSTSPAPLVSSWSIFAWRSAASFLRYTSSGLWDDDDDESFPGVPDDGPLWGCTMSGFGAAGVF